MNWKLYKIPELIQSRFFFPFSLSLDKYRFPKSIKQTCPVLKFQTVAHSRRPSMEFTPKCQSKWRLHGKKEIEKLFCWFSQETSVYFERLWPIHHYLHWVPTQTRHQTAHHATSNKQHRPLIVHCSWNTGYIQLSSNLFRFQMAYSTLLNAHRVSLKYSRQKCAFFLR